MEASNNILIYNSSFFEGSETFIYNQYKALSAHNCILIAHEFKNNERFPTNKQTKKVLIDLLPITLWDRFVHWWRRKSLKRSRLLPISAERSIQSIHQKQPINFIHAHFGPNGIAITDLAKKLRIPLMVSFHGYDASQLLLDEEYKKELLSMMEYASLITVCAAKMKQDLVSATNPTFSQKVRVIHYGVDIAHIEQIPYVKNNGDAFTIIHAGRLTPKKGVLDLIKVFHQVQLQLANTKLHLEIVGSGEELSKANQLVRDLGLSDNVTFFGALPHEALLSRVKAADLFVLNSRVSPSGDSEGFPNSILEAMAAKTAVISTRHAGIPEVVIHNETGLLVDEFDNNHLKESIMSLIGSETIRLGLVERAFQKVRNNFSHVKSDSNLKRAIFETSSLLV